MLAEINGEFRTDATLEFCDLVPSLLLRSLGSFGGGVNRRAGFADFANPFGPKVNAPPPASARDLAIFASLILFSWVLR